MECWQKSLTLDKVTGLSDRLTQADAVSEKTWRFVTTAFYVVGLLFTAGAVAGGYVFTSVQKSLEAAQVRASDTVSSAVEQTKSAVKDEMARIAAEISRARAELDEAKKEAARVREEAGKIREEASKTKDEAAKSAADVLQSKLAIMEIRPLIEKYKNDVDAAVNRVEAERKSFDAELQKTKISLLQDLQHILAKADAKTAEGISNIVRDAAAKAVAEQVAGDEVVRELRAKIKPGLNLLPVGSVTAFAGEVNKVSDGWMICDGRPLDKVKYGELFNAIGTTYGDGTKDVDGKAAPPGIFQFNLPDYRGLFLRGLNGDRKDENADPDCDKRTGGNKIGSLQKDGAKVFGKETKFFDDNKKIPDTDIRVFHDVGLNNKAVLGESCGPRDSLAAADYFSIRSFKVLGGFSEETRPKNIAVHYIIKAK
jgi:hypothetical protein